jgi:hypothetical protein
MLNIPGRIADPKITYVDDGYIGQPAEKLMGELMYDDSGKGQDRYDKTRDKHGLFLLIKQI